MKTPIQPLGFKKSPYERPNQKWVCGWAEHGNPCPHGPNGKGKCSVAGHTSCKPIKDEQTGRFHCNRAKVFGGECENGPLPDGKCCNPTPPYPPCPVSYTHLTLPTNA